MIVENARPTTLQKRLKPTLGTVLIHRFAIGYSDLPLLGGKFPFCRFSAMSGHAIAQEAAIVGKHVTWLNPDGHVMMFWLDLSCEIFDADKKAA